MHCKMFCGFPGLYPLEARSNLSIVITKNISKILPNVPWGAKLLLTEKAYTKRLTVFTSREERMMKGE